MKKAFLFLVMALVLSLASSGWAAVFRVTNEAELRTALMKAASNREGDIIYIAKGIYKTLIYMGKGKYKTSKKTFFYSPDAAENYPLTVKGAGPGSTILDGGGSDQVMSIDTKEVADDKNSHITVAGIRFQNGNGGGLFIGTNQANVIVDDCEFMRNKGHGASVGSRSGTVTFTNNSFRENKAGMGGGAVAYSTSGTLRFTNNTFSKNTANGGGGGARACSDSGTVTFTNNAFSENKANYGGGVYADSKSGTVSFTKNKFIRNTVDGEGGALSGGGVDARVSSGALRFTNNTFIENNAWRGGGALGYCEGGSVTFINNLFHGNIVRHWGGGAEAECRGTVTFTNNTFSKNTAGKSGGGGLYVKLSENSATAHIYNNIVWHNKAPGKGDDIYVNDDANDDSIGAAVNLYNNNYGADPDDFFIKVGDHLFQGIKKNSDPLIVNPATGDFHLQAGSPCIDAGTSNAPNLPKADFEGDSRIIDGDNDGTATVDIGADEYILTHAQAPSKPAAPAPIPKKPAPLYVAFAPAKDLRVTGSKVNVRDGPGTNYPVITVVRAGQMLKGIGKEGKWYNVRLPDGEMGWISSRLVTEE